MDYEYYVCAAQIIVEYIPEYGSIFPDARIFDSFHTLNYFYVAFEDNWVEDHQWRIQGANWVRVPL